MGESERESGRESSSERGEREDSGMARDSEQRESRCRESTGESERESDRGSKWRANLFALSQTTESKKVMCPLAEISFHCSIEGSTPGCELCVSCVSCVSCVWV